MPYERELEIALQAASQAGDLVLQHYERFEVVPDAPASITTDADRESQEVILQTIRAAFPDDAFSAEEATPTLEGAAQSGPRLWIVDPIDGTRGFARKNGEFSLMVAFVDAGRIAAGVVLEAAKGRLTYAVRGGGCWRRDRDEAVTPCRVSAIARLSDATLTQSRSRDPGVPSGHVKALGPAKVVEAYSAGLKLALVARGEADLYVNRYLAFHDWDICAGHILVEEAGGQVTGLNREPLRYGLPGAWQRQGLLATNGLLHEAALAGLARA